MLTDRNYRLWAVLFAVFILIPSLSMAAEAPVQPSGPVSIETPAELAKQLEANPNDNLLRLRYAGALLDCNKITEAATEYFQVRNSDKKNTEAIIGLAICYDRMEKSSLALEECNNAYKLNPTDPNTVMVLVACAYNNGKVQEAIPALDILAKTDKSKSAFCCWTIAEWLVGKDPSSAQIFAKKANELDSKNYPKSQISPQGVGASGSQAAQGQTSTQDKSWQHRLMCRVPVPKPASTSSG